MAKKSIAEAYILGITFGLFGAHHFYLGRRFFGILYACTLGLFGIGYLFDLVRMRTLVRHVNQHGPDGKILSDCYLLCALGGWFGAHYFYLGKKRDGCFYALTLGILGVGVVVDMFRMKSLFQVRSDPTLKHRMNKITAYTLCLSPLGLLGIHELYLKQDSYYLVYIFFFYSYIIVCMSLGVADGFNIILPRLVAGLCIIVCRWIFFTARLSVIYERAVSDTKDKYLNVEDAYLWWFPIGFIGFHNAYLGRPIWVILYVFSFGCFGIGWLIDGFRIPKLVKEYNKSVTERNGTDVSTEQVRVVPSDKANSYEDRARAKHAPNTRSPDIFHSTLSGTMQTLKPIPEDRVSSAVWADHVSASDAGKSPAKMDDHHGVNPAKVFVHDGPIRLHIENDNVADTYSKIVPGVRMVTNRDHYSAMRPDYVASSDIDSLSGVRVATNRDRYGAMRSDYVAASDMVLSISGVGVATNRDHFSAMRPDYVASSDIGSLSGVHVATNRDRYGAMRSDYVAASGMGSIPGGRILANRDRYGAITADNVAASDSGSIPRVRRTPHRDS